MVHHPIVDEFQSLIQAIELDNTQSIKIEYDVGHRVPCILIGVCVGIICARVLAAQ